ncbi:hypothetical protein ANO11243_066280 [Dothideomycetidae sp. 11243]|nr:hypothetical protein ANO11243_066280 [fungal sp. No.11243]
MVRTLPWLKNANATSPARPRPRPSSSRGDNVTPRKTRTAPGAKDAHIPTPDKQNRSIVTDEPSADQSRDTSGLSPMREGYDADDIWMMVEDEFQATAQLFTQHLHQAEYIRLQNQAREQEESMMTRSPRPMAGFMPHHRSTLSKRRKPLDSDSEGTDDGASDSALAGLMDSPMKQPALLMRSSVAEPQTPSAGRRASRVESLQYGRQSSSKPGEQATGQGLSTVEDGESDDDDLDAPIRPRINPSDTRTISSDSSLLTKLKRSRDEQRMKAPTKPLPRPSNAERGLGDDLFSDMHDTSSRRTADIVAARRNKGKVKKTPQVDDTDNEFTTEIPTFLV